MWRDLERLRSVGSAKALRSVFEAISDGKPHEVGGVRRFVSSKLYFGAGEFDGALALLETIGHIAIRDGSVRLIASDPDANYPHCSQFAEALLKSCRDADYIPKVFEPGVLFRDPQTDDVLIRKSHIPIAWLGVWTLLSDTRLISPNEQDTHGIVSPLAAGIFLTYIAKPLNDSAGLAGKSLEALKADKARKELLGRRCEEIALAYELERLKGHPMLDSVRLISEQNVGAGFDLVSFENLQSLTHDRFIEVKAFGGTRCFYWSSNESAVARELGERYYLYLISPEAATPRVIQDPYSYFQLHQDEWAVTPESYRYCSTGPIARSE